MSVVDALAMIAMGLTLGNLQSHLTRLEAAGFIGFKRVLVDLSFEMRYKITAKGAEAFRSYLEALDELLRTDE